MEQLYKRKIFLSHIFFFFSNSKGSFTRGIFNPNPIVMTQLQPVCNQLSSVNKCTHTVFSPGTIYITSHGFSNGRTFCLPERISQWLNLTCATMLSVLSSAPVGVCHCPGSDGPVFSCSGVICVLSICFSGLCSGA